VQTACNYSLYEQILDLPETLTGEILDGQIHTQPRPSGPHAIAGSSLGDELVGPFQKGRGGPGGWWIIDEPEVHFVRDTEVAVPDLAGWRRERMPKVPEGHRFEVVPDWICEILSPSTASKDCEVKMPLYARYGVCYAWLIDPKLHTLEIFRLQGKAWIEAGHFTGGARVAAAPFEAIGFDLADLWV
jgi:Uma2 family endonuclease